MSEDPAPPRAYRRDGTHGRLVHALGQRIVTGELAPGAPLPIEAKLVEEFGTSRSAVREAVKVLTAKGLVVARTKVGTTVQPESSWNLLDPDVLAWRYTGDPTDAQLDDLAGMRVAVEPEAARLAARSRDRRALAAIRDAYRLMESTLDDPDEFIQHDLDFHRAVVEAGGNLLLVHLDDVLGVALAAAREVHSRNVRRNRRSLPAHRAVLNAITARDADTAAGLMRELVRNAQHDIRRDRRRPTSPESSS
jgi:DNA-binding FadR family transcriptional regulator